MERRFDDLVRSERYFTATLLPAVLFHNNLEGVQHFVELVDNEAKSERNSSGEPSEMGAPEYGNFRDVEVITEFHIARDLTFAGLRLEANVGPSEEGATERRDAPDVVIVAGRELVVCEGKFFSNFNAENLNKQLRSQRCQVHHLLLNRQQIRAYRHVAIVPERFDEPTAIDADVVLTWDDIRELAEKLMGCDHYVTVRLREAAKRYECEGDRDIRNYTDILPFMAMREKCRELGDKVWVGHDGGKADLLKRDLVGRVVHSAGYNLFNFTRAFSVVNRQSASACFLLRSASQASTSSFSIC
jgi:hypothetical protein